MKVEVDVLGSPSLMVLNVVCGRKATLNLNLRHVLCSVQFGKWGGGGVGGGEGGGTVRQHALLWYQAFVKSDHRYLHENLILTHIHLKRMIILILQYKKWPIFDK